MSTETLADGVQELVASAWEEATGAQPPTGNTAFAAACWRTVEQLNAFEDYGVADVAVIRRARSWFQAKGRREWDPPPILLCNFNGRERGRHLFWLVDREEARRHGEDV